MENVGNYFYTVELFKRNRSKNNNASLLTFTNNLSYLQRFFIPHFPHIKISKNLFFRPHLKCSTKRECFDNKASASYIENGMLNILKKLLPGDKEYMEKFINNIIISIFSFIPLIRENPSVIYKDVCLISE